VHLQLFLSIPITKKCQILSRDALVANERYIGHADKITCILYFGTRPATLFTGLEKQREKSGKISPYIYIYIYIYIYTGGPGSSFGIATDYGLDGPGLNPVGDEIGAGANPASCKIDTECFPGVKCGQGVLLTTHPLLVPRSWKSRAIPLPTIWATPGL